MSEGRASACKKASKVLLVASVLFAAVGGPAELYSRSQTLHSSAAKPATATTAHRGSGGAGLRRGAPESCPSFRGEYDPAALRADAARSGVDLWSHTRVDPSCPRFVYAEQNPRAGFGHRFNQWLAALHVSRMRGLTFAHTGFEGGVGSHGRYEGWDAWLNLSGGEWSEGGARAYPGVRGGTLSNVGGEYYKNERGMKDLEPQLAECNRVWNMGMDHWFYDHSTSTKAVVALKFHDQMEGRGGMGVALDSAGATYDPTHVNVAVHVRVGDQYPTKERVHADIIRGTLWPALVAAGVRGMLAVHVFAEDTAAFVDLTGLDVTLTSPGLRAQVFLHPDIPPLPTLYLLTAADFLTMSYSSFSYAGGHLALRPLVFSPRSSDDFRMCTDTMVCCDETGRCGMDAHQRAATAARRVAAMQACGSWAAAAPYAALHGGRGAGGRGGG